MINRSFRRRRLFLFGLLAFLPVALHAADDYWPKEHWRTATPESQGMCSEILTDMMDRLWQKNLELESILIVRNGYVVLDSYHFPNTPDAKHDLYSCTKSISSTLVGIAIDKGYIPSVDQPLLDFFPAKVPGNPDNRKQLITLKNVLQMTTGLKCRDSIHYRWKGLRALRGSRDWVQYMLDLPMAEAPGVRFEYCNGASFLLTAIIQETTGQSGRAFAQAHLFDPMGIHDIEWPANHRGRTIGWGRLQMLPRDMAKFGYLFLKEGRWNGRQIVSACWVAEATRSHIAVGPASGYGYQWWVMDSGDYAAIGYRGQRIYVLKDHDMVVVMTGRLKNLDRFLPSGLLRRYILPAVKSDRPLPANPTALNRLKSLDRFWQTANSHERDKRRKELARAQSRPEWKQYVNQQNGFSLTYAADLDVSGQAMEPPVVFKKSGLNGFPILVAIIDDIPQELPLKESEDYIVRHIKESNRVSDISVKHKELIQLPDGTPFNYFEMQMKYLGFDFAAFGVVGYKEKRLIGVYAAGGGLETPFADLRHMVRSLRFE